ncbi:MAG TPA: sulfatase [Gemmatimonadales bacterium]|nr:sulfatase [Gemmatimonadales bacterium]
MRPLTSWHPPLSPLLRGATLVAVASLAACSTDSTPTDPSGPAARDGPTSGQPFPSAAARPNVVVIMSDDQSVRDMQVMSQTRKLVGAAGVTFRNSTVTYSLCCPSRATLLTGQYPHNHGVRSNQPPDGGVTALDQTNTLPLWLQEAGYVTGHIGKYLNGYGQVDPLEVPPGYTEWYGSIDPLAYEYYGYVLNENGILVTYGSTPDQYQADVYTAKAVDFIGRRGPAAATGGEPFFLFVTYLAPHRLNTGDPAFRKAVPAPRHQGRFAGELLPQSPAFNEADMSDKPASMRRRPLMTAAQVTELGAAHRALLESLLAVDEGVAAIVNALQGAGVLQNTLVVYTSDNGWFQGEHRIVFGKVLPYEPAVKVPLLIRGPGVTPRRNVGAPVANIDLAPTIVAAAGASARRTMDGRSLWPLLQGQATWATPRHVLVEDSPLGGAASVFWSIRKAKFVYTEYANGDREFYDLAKDSAQVASRHADPAYAAIRLRLAKRLAAMKTCRGPTACW